MQSYKSYTEDTLPVQDTHRGRHEATKKSINKILFQTNSAKHKLTLIFLVHNFHLVEVILVVTDALWQWMGGWGGVGGGGLYTA